MACSPEGSQSVWKRTLSAACDAVAAANSAATAAASVCTTYVIWVSRARRVEASKDCTKRGRLSSPKHSGRHDDHGLNRRATGVAGGARAPALDLHAVALLACRT